ncbi:hypothetical protein NVIRPANT_00946 [Pantoea sp. Nvir]|nr:hypothetical protein NVIRPANT_00946 [Pantoea sp. Nvir]
MLCYNPQAICNGVGCGMCVQGVLFSHRDTGIFLFSQ